MFWNLNEIKMMVVMVAFWQTQLSLE